MLDALDLGEHLLHGYGHEAFDLGRARTRERHEDVCERDVDLRFFLARRYEHGEETEQQARQGE